MGGLTKCGYRDLHVAVGNGHLDTCQLLLQLQGPYLSDKLLVSVLQLAILGQQKAVVQWLVNNLADVNEVCTETESRLMLPSPYNVYSGSPLNMIMQRVLEGPHTPEKYGMLDCAVALVQAGAKRTGLEVTAAAKNLHLELLTTSLAGGGDPNEERDGETALQLLCRGEPYVWFSEEQKRDQVIHVVKLLLANGAIQKGGEVASAAFLGDWHVVLELIRYGGSLMDTHSSGTTILEAAILSQCYPIVQDIFSIQPHIYDEGSLCAAVFVKKLWLVERLLSNRPHWLGPSILETTAIGIAANFGLLDLLNRLLESLPCADLALVPKYEFDAAVGIRENWYLANVNRMTFPFWRRPNIFDPGMGSPLAMAVMAFQEGEEICHELLRRGCRPDWITWTALADSNNLSLARFLLQNCPSLQPPVRNMNITNPLTLAIENGNTEMVKLLRDVGIDVNDHNLGNSYSCSPLQTAVDQGNLDIMDYLLKAGANVNAPPARTGGATALQLAAIRGYLGIAKHLLELGANINAEAAEWEGRTALLGAAEHGRLDMLELLIQNGALDGDKALHQLTCAIRLAKRERHGAAVELLKGHWRWGEYDTADIEDGEFVTDEDEEFVTDEDEEFVSDEDEEFVCDEEE